MEERKDHTKKVGRRKKEIEKLLESHRTGDVSEKKSYSETGTGLAVGNKHQLRSCFCITPPPSTLYSIRPSWRRRSGEGGEYPSPEFILELFVNWSCFVRPLSLSFASLSLLLLGWPPFVVKWWRREVGREKSSYDRIIFHPFVVLPPAKLSVGLFSRE